jgi:murein L,D-transpeptidase YafK
MTHVQRHRIGLTVAVTFVLLGLACNGAEPLADDLRADKIMVVKSAHTMSLLKGSQVFRTYRIALGRNPVGAKTRHGDHKTPEGNYIVDAKKNKSRFHRALHISYPNQADRERVQRDGVKPGGEVEIHGVQNGLGWLGARHRRIDWTDGCIAVTNDEIDEIWKMVDVGTPVEIRP